MLRINFWIQRSWNGKISGTKELNAGEILKEWRHTQRCPPTGISEKCSLTRPLPSPVVTLGTRLSSSGVWKWVKFLQAQSTSTFLRLREWKPQQQYIHRVWKQKSRLERKVYFFAPPCSSLLPSPRFHPLTCVVIIPFFLFYYRALICGFLSVGWMYCCWRQRKDAEGHIKRDDNIVFMDQGSCISFSKGTFFSIPFLY